MAAEGRQRQRHSGVAEVQMRDPRPVQDARRGHVGTERRNERAGSAHETHGLRHLLRGAIPPWCLAGHALEDHVALVVLRKARQAEVAHQRREVRLHMRPEPGRPQVEPVGRRCASVVRGEDAPAEALAGFDEEEVEDAYREVLGLD